MYVWLYASTVVSVSTCVCMCVHVCVHVYVCMCARISPPDMLKSLTFFDFIFCPSQSVGSRCGSRAFCVCVMTRNLTSRHHLNKFTICISSRLKCKMPPALVTDYDIQLSDNVSKQSKKLKPTVTETKSIYVRCMYMYLCVHV
jgi:hypothetical protein